MPYRIIFLAGQKEVGSTRCTGNLVFAKQHAVDQMGRNASQYGANSAEVRTQDGVLLWARPNTAAVAEHLFRLEHHRLNDDF